MPAISECTISPVSPYVLLQDKNPDTLFIMNRCNINHDFSLLRLLRRLTFVLMLMCVPAAGMAQKTRIIPPKRPAAKPATKPSPKPAPQKKAKPAPVPEPPKPPTVSDPTGFINGHGYVDLGLPSGTKWATCNVGASSPSDYGDYFAWGEIAPKEYYDRGNCVTYGKDYGGDIGGDPSLDAARANWGASWRLPTKEQIVELIKYTTCNLLTCDGHRGRVYVGPNGNSIFLPLPGFCAYENIRFPEERIYLWTSTPASADEDHGRAYILFDVGSRGDGTESRARGYSVRPVAE